MSDFDASGKESLEALQRVLVTLVRRMTRMIWSNARIMQMDVGNAIYLLHRTGEFPRRNLLARALPDLLRELGKPRPDLYRYVIVLEDTAKEIDEILQRPW